MKRFSGPSDASALANPLRYRGQDFKKIKNWCVKNGVYFEDPFFYIDQLYEWRRPFEIVNSPQLFVDGVSRFDVLQGDLGNCWMLAAIATLAMHPELVKKVIPSDQDFRSHYAGVFHFRFWQFGKWYDVVVDDRLPTVNGQLVFTRSSTHNEFWSALFEKAYCKILGESYSVADSGNLCEALEDFTGGVVEQFLLRAAPRNFQSIFVNSIEKESLIGCFIDDKPGEYQARTAEGLVRGHSYSVTGHKVLKLPKLQGGEILLIRLRNPWGRFEWKGAWSDNSPEWKSVPDSQKKRLGLVSQDDGEFWMSYTDFFTHFQWVDMCHMSPDAFSVLEDRRSSDASKWQLNMFRGSWVVGITAGGSKVLHCNPQMRFTLRTPDSGNSNGKCSVLIALIQKTCGKTLSEYREIGFKVFALTDPKYNSSPLDQKYFMKYRSVAQVPVKKAREVAGRFVFDLGSYCIIPFTYEPHQDGDFLLRIYSERKTITDQVKAKVNICEVDFRLNDFEDAPMTKPDGKESLEIESEKLLKENFDRIAGASKEINWKGLKEMMAFAVKNSKSPGGGGLGGLIMDVASFIYKIITPGSQVADAFDTLGPDGFSDDVCRSMVAFADTHHSGKVDYHEFKKIWREVKKWKILYEHFCKDNEKFLQTSQLRKTLKAAGFRLNNRILQDAVHRYSEGDGTISFDGLLNFGLKIRNMTDSFKSRDVNKSCKAEFSLEEFLEEMMYT